jgi:SAM-dependent methyltransferase
MKVQDKKAEIWLTEREIEEGAWEDSELQYRGRMKQLQLLQPVLSQDQLILDAGCGPGNYGIILANKNEVIGVDICSKATQTARERANKGKVRFWPIVGDLETLPFSNHSFDTCFCAYTLHHFPDIRNVVRELVRVTKPEGNIVLFEPNGSDLGVKVSKSLENLIGSWLVKSGLDTPNETIHKPKYYVEERGRYTDTGNPPLFWRIASFPQQISKTGLDPGYRLFYRSSSSVNIHLTK